MSEIQKTVLNQLHYDAGAKMVDFHGWEMPVQYDGILAEHRRTRTTGSLFDVSHMGEFALEGPDALKNLQKITCNDVSKLAITQVQYSAMFYEDGSVVDDLTVYRLGEDKFQLCVNASNIEKDFNWIKEHLEGDVSFENLSDQISLIAVQGSKAEELLQAQTEDDLKHIKYYWCDAIELMGFPVLAARMGYTGEDGFEIFCRNEDAAMIWKTLAEKGEPLDIKPAGLGARDTLRLEVCYPLYGNDLDDKHSALESALAWIIKINKGEFIGRDALLKEDKEGIKNRLVPLKLKEKGVPRQGYVVYDELQENEIGMVTSGTSSPMLNEGIGMARLQSKFAKAGTDIFIKIRKKMVPAVVTKGAFVTIKK
jgi:aminomethyltransferase